MSVCWHWEDTGRRRSKQQQALHARQGASSLRLPLLLLDVRTQKSERHGDPTQGNTHDRPSYPAVPRCSSTLPNLDLPVWSGSRRQRWPRP